MTDGPEFSSDRHGDTVRLVLGGRWTVDASAAIEARAGALVAESSEARQVILDLGRVARLDTAGAWLIDRARQALQAKGIDARLESVRPEFEILLREAGYREILAPRPRGGSFVFRLLSDIGESVVSTGADLYRGIGFLGEVVAAIAKSLVNPSRFRATSLMVHIETIAFRGAPIIALINFLAGAILAQQGIFQLRRFGATIFVVNLIGILILRDLGVLLAAIMTAGRSGSAITAELGSMKLHEEIDALTVLGLRPTDILIVPRILALIVSLPLLTFVADMSGLFGGLLVSWVYEDITPARFMSGLQTAVGLNTFFAGLIKAPFMALVIGLIACVEGLAVEGSAESLGRHVTSSVVKSIFMIVVVDGLFAMFYAGIRY
ncbi:MAG: ABC transporter permease [Beijerinckiaceae bacterium]|nr:ABC transporter permease [Beijerinckiaceae bacterium]MCI0736286.1 ABC transporter permease [Beijerinckiaceae bacterium]